jgi:hypothetical protein
MKLTKLVRAIGLLGLIGYFSTIFYLQHKFSHREHGEGLHWDGGKYEGRIPEVKGRHTKQTPVLFLKEKWADVLYVYNDYGSLEYRVINPKGLHGH